MMIKPDSSCLLTYSFHKDRQMQARSQGGGGGVGGGGVVRPPPVAHP